MFSSIGVYMTICTKLFVLNHFVFPNLLQAFVAPSVGQPALASTTSLDASRINAKQEKRKRNRENMRKFKKGGRKGTSRKKMMRKMASSAARQVSEDFTINLDMM